MAVTVSLFVLATVFILLATPLVVGTFGDLLCVVVVVFVVNVDVSGFLIGVIRLVTVLVVVVDVTVLLIGLYKQTNKQIVNIPCI